MALGTQRARRAKLMERIVDIARRMRAAQKRYFKDRKQTDLVESKSWEKELDKLLGELEGFELRQKQRRGMALRQAVMAMGEGMR